MNEIQVKVKEKSIQVDLVVDGFVKEQLGSYKLRHHRYALRRAIAASKAYGFRIVYL